MRVALRRVHPDGQLSPTERDDGATRTHADEHLAFLRVRPKDVRQAGLEHLSIVSLLLCARPARRARRLACAARVE